jgi:DNA (cytosine-5)-methyltransferase 1
MNSAAQVTEIFAGIGFSEVLRTLGLRSCGLEMDAATCATRRAAKHLTTECDVTQHPTAPFAGTEGLIGGPPCPPFGKSGRKLGLTDLPLVHEAVDDLARGVDSRARLGAGCLDPRSILTAEPVRWLYGLRPQWVVLEQVDSVLPVWGHVAEILERWGYSTAAGVLHAERYGAGQSRPRAILLASRVREVALPAPTHGGPGQPPLVAMADVIGWGYTRRPSPAVTGGGVYTGGAEPFGNGSRQAMRKVIGTDAWQDRRPLCGREHGEPDEPCGHLRPSLAECAALQGFRPDLVFHGKSGQQHLQVGNAVPRALARAAVLAASGAGERVLEAAA